MCGPRTTPSSDTWSKSSQARSTLKNHRMRGPSVFRRRSHDMAIAGIPWWNKVRRPTPPVILNRALWGIESCWGASGIAQVLGRVLGRELRLIPFCDRRALPGPCSPALVGWPDARTPKGSPRLAGREGWSSVVGSCSRPSEVDRMSGATTSWTGPLLGLASRVSPLADASSNRVGTSPMRAPGGSVRPPSPAGRASARAALPMPWRQGDEPTCAEG